MAIIPENSASRGSHVALSQEAFAELSVSGREENIGRGEAGSRNQSVKPARDGQ